MIRGRCNSKQIYVLLSPLKSVGLEQRNFVRTVLKDSQREGDMREVYKTMYGKETDRNKYFLFSQNVQDTLSG